MGRSDAPLFGIRGALIAVALGVVLTWPILLTGDAFVYFDTAGYLSAGETIWNILLSVFDAPGNGGGDGGSGETARGGGRAIVYAAFAYLLTALTGPVGLAVTQGALAVFATLVLIGRDALTGWRVLIVGGVAVAALTTLPWHSVYMMPDVFGAVVLVFGAVLVSPFDRLTASQKICLVLISAFAAATHYGNTPLAAGVCGAALLIRLLRGNLGAAPVIAAIVVVLTAPAINIVSSTVVLGTPSAAPLRLPVLLARSLEDGPARLYLEENCGESDYAICAAFGDDIPQGLQSLLWSDDGISSLTADQVADIRREEYALLWDVWKAYPLRQTHSLSRNALLQLTKAGTGQIYGVEDIGDTLPPEEDTRGERLVNAFDSITMTATGIAALALLGLWATGRMTEEERHILLMLVVGLLLNAAIFGGLSAPADRYQSRLVWLLPAFLVIVLARMSGARRFSSRAQTG